MFAAADSTNINHTSHSSRSRLPNSRSTVSFQIASGKRYWSATGVNTVWPPKEGSWARREEEIKEKITVCSPINLPLFSSCKTMRGTLFVQDKSNSRMCALALSLSKHVSQVFITAPTNDDGSTRKTMLGDILHLSQIFPHCPPYTPEGTE
ncbi:hypothetical protein BaRGS_00008403 [Batillaria attramentaria]|uniref:Uncharacterized protein n=1 Tax=Batillaria attramentaria TaxID=370345 RepID=A0ABD0LMM4_9CAEN